MYEYLVKNNDAQSEREREGERERLLTTDVRMQRETVDN